MEKKTPNKRKSLINSNVTPNKIRKIDSPVSQNIINKSANKNGNISKSPNKNQNITSKKQMNGNHTKRNNKDEQLEITLNESANKIKQNQTNGNKSKSPNKNQNITPKKQINGKQSASKKQMNTKQTAPKKNKKSMQVEEDDVELMDDSNEYDSDNSIEEMNDSDFEEAARDEADSDENAQVDEDESGEEVEVEEDEESDLDEEENDDDKLENDGTGDSDGEAEHEEIDEEDNVNEKEAKHKFSVYVQGLKPDLTMDRIFPGCNIENHVKLFNRKLRVYGKTAIVNFKDKESFKKALANPELNIDGNKISVDLASGSIEFSVAIHGLHPDADVRDLFNDCNILSVKNRKFVTFEDKESMQKALLKNGSEINGSSIKIEPNKLITERVINLSVRIKGLNSDVKIENILESCNIKFYYLRTYNNIPIYVDVAFEDEESVQKALLKHETKYNGSVIEVYRKHCGAYVRGIQKNAKMEKIFPGCKIHAVELKMNEDELKGAVVHFQDYASLEKALSMKTPPGITVDCKYFKKLKNLRNKFENKSVFIKNKFNKPPYQQTRGNEGKKMLLQELKSQVQKLTEEVYGTSRSRPKPFMSARRNPRINT